MTIKAPNPSRSGPSSRGTTTAARSRINRTAIWALVLSVLGLTSPIGLFLAYRSLGQIERTRELGAPFAVAAKWIGWLWVVFLVLALSGYFWITMQGS